MKKEGASSLPNPFRKELTMSSQLLRKDTIPGAVKPGLKKDFYGPSPSSNSGAGNTSSTTTLFSPNSANNNNVNTSNNKETNPLPQPTGVNVPSAETKGVAPQTESVLKRENSRSIARKEEDRKKVDQFIEQVKEDLKSLPSANARQEQLLKMLADVKRALVEKERRCIKLERILLKTKSKKLSISQDKIKKSRRHSITSPLEDDCSVNEDLEDEDDESSVGKTSTHGKDKKPYKARRDRRVTWNSGVDSTNLIHLLHDESFSSSSPRDFYPFDSPDSSQNLVLEDEHKDADMLKNISAASVEKLVEKITCGKYNDTDTMITWFILAHRYCTTSERLLTLLFARFIGPTKAHDKTIHLIWKVEKDDIQLGVLRVLHRWMSLHPAQLEEEEIKKKINTFLTKEAAKFVKSERVSSQLSICVDAYNQLLKPRESIKFISDNSQISYIAKLANPDFFAEQLTVLEFELMRKIKPEEYIKQAWNKAGKEEKAPNLTSAIEWFNKLSRWFATVVLTEESPEGRSVIISNLISVGKRCQHLNNYNAIMEILSCLHSASISRLKLTWSLVKSNFVETFESLGKLMSPKANFKRYREALRGNPPGTPVVPHLGTFLTDFTFLDDCKPDDVDGLVNFEKIRSFGEKLCVLKSFGSVSYAITANKEFKDFIDNINVWYDNDIYRISKLREDPSTEARFISNKKKKMGLSQHGRYFESGGITGQMSVSTSSKELGPRDWEFLLVGAQSTSYKRDQVIVEQDTYNQFFYRIKTGRVRVEKFFDNKNFPPKFVASLLEGQTFGEMSVFDPTGKTTARVVADEYHVEIYQIELSFVFKLFESKPQLSVKFFKNLAVTLAKRLREQSTARVTPTSIPTLYPQSSLPEVLPRRRSSTSTPSPRNPIIGEEGETIESKLCRKLGIETQIVIREYPCTLKTKLNHTGIIYLLQHFVGFYSRVFSMEIKLAIPHASITSIEKGKQCDITIYSSDSKKSMSLRFKRQADCNEAIAILRKMTKLPGNMGENPSATIEESPPLSTVPKAASARQIFSASKDHQSSVSMNNLLHPSNSSGPKMEDTVDWSKQRNLTKDDWDRILSGAKAQIFSKNEVVIAEGQSYQRLYSISRGMCRIEKLGTVLGFMNPGEMFGEISFLEGSGAAVSVIADDEEVELQLIEGYFINILFENERFAARFYHYLCSLLIARLKQ